MRGPLINQRDVAAGFGQVRTDRSAVRAGAEDRDFFSHDLENLFGWPEASMTAVGYNKRSKTLRAIRKCPALSQQPPDGA